MPLIVKPNPRQAREFMNSPSVGRFAGRRRLVPASVLPRFYPVVAVAAVVLLAALLLAAYVA